ncbi:MAG: RnfH family protein [Gammaproteobacteria bacterium]|nr:RnfH family protein [Gammaproteobacteria bacterium]
MSEQSDLVSVEVAYALPDKQRIIALQVKRGTTAAVAVELSGIAREFPQIDPHSAAMGIFSRPLDGKASPLPQDYVLNERDRVEIYRPLQIDPMQARLLRAARARKKALAAGLRKR